MKKRFAIFCLVLVAATMAISCAHKTCPAYRGSIAQNTIVVNE